MLESIKTLRDKNYSPGFRGMPTLEMVADAIDQEISERYMLLPVDADGEPIHVGDVMTLRHGKTCEVVAVSESQFTGKKPGNEKPVCHANQHRHFKPRTLEDVLHDFANEAEWEQSPGTYEEIESRLITLYAAEIREMIGGEL